MCCKQMTSWQGKTDLPAKHEQGSIPQTTDRRAPLPSAFDFPTRVWESKRVAKVRHASVLQSSFSVSLPSHTCPPPLPGTSIFRVRFFSPPPHDLSHLVHAPHSLHLQSTAKNWYLLIWEYGSNKESFSTAKNLAVVSDGVLGSPMSFARIPWMSKDSWSGKL